MLKIERIVLTTDFREAYLENKKNDNRSKLQDPYEVIKDVPMPQLASIEIKNITGNNDSEPVFEEYREYAVYAPYSMNIVSNIKTVTIPLGFSINITKSDNIAEAYLTLSGKLKDCEDDDDIDFVGTISAPELNRSGRHSSPNDDYACMLSDGAVTIQFVPGGLMHISKGDEIARIYTRGFLTIDDELIEFFKNVGFDMSILKEKAKETVDEKPTENPVKKVERVVADMGTVFVGANPCRDD